MMSVPTTNTIMVSTLMTMWACLFYPVFRGLMEAWFDLPNSDNSYGVLVPLISLYFAWKKKEELSKAEISGSGIGLVVLAASLFIFLLSYLGGIAFLQRLMSVVSLIGLVMYLFGKDVFKILAFPLLFLFFMVPIPESVINIISFPLQTYATVIAEKIIRMCAVPVYREGHMLYFANTQLEVAEACSGIRSMTALLMLSIILSYGWKISRTFKAMFILSSLLVALLANVCRVSGTGILAHLFGDRVAKGFLHEFSGMGVFAIGFMLLFVEFRIMNRMRPGG